MPKSRFHHLAWHHGIELFEAEFCSQTFTRHAHEGFAIGVIAEGAGGDVCREKSMVLPAGSLSLMNPEEAHTGHRRRGGCVTTCFTPTRRRSAKFGPEQAERLCADRAAGSGICVDAGAGTIGRLHEPPES